MIKGINLNTYEVECSCDLKNENHDSNNEENIKNLLDNPLSNEVFGVLTNSNIGVLKCIKQAFDKKIVFKNYGGLMMIGLITIQIVCAVFIKIQMRKVERFIYTFISQIKYPPKRKATLVKFQTQKNSNIKNNLDIKDNDIISKASKDIIINDITPKENNEQNNKLNINNKVRKDLISNNNKKNRTHKLNNNYRNRNDNYKLIKQGSLVSTSSLLNTKETKDKFTFVKKGTIPFSTQYTNFISKEKDNSPNKSGSELNIFNINNSNNSSGSGSSSGEKDDRINSGASDTVLYKLEEINKSDDRDKDTIIEEERKTNFFEERGKGVGTYLDEDVIGIDKGPKRFKTYINSKEKK